MIEPLPAATLTPDCHMLMAGWVDLERLAVAPIAVEHQSETRIRISAPGLWIDIEASNVAWHVSDSGIVLALGTPMLRGRSASATNLCRLIVDGSVAGDLSGRYAIVLIDLARRQVRMRTDRFAVWPICWTQECNRLAFSDRADAVPTTVPRTIDPQALFDYAYFHMIPAPRTVYRGILRLEPASELSFGFQGVSVRQFWSPSFSRQRKLSVSTLSSRFRNALRDAVAYEAGGENVGCFLSGGTDSSTVAGMLKQTTGSARSFSIGFAEEGYDEMEFARLAARHFGTEHHEHYMRPTEVVEAAPRVAAYYDQPFGNSSAIPALICASLASEMGVRKLLAGDGGDELFGGNTRYAKQKVFEAWWSLPAPLRAALRGVLANPTASKVRIVRKAASYVAQAGVPMPARFETYNLLSRFGHDSVFQPSFLEQVQTGDPARLQSEVYGRQRDAAFVDRMLAYDWRFTLADNDLPKVRGTAQLAGLAVGFPLLSDTVVDLSTELSARDKVRGSTLRHFFKQSLVGFLPPEIIAKKKHGFGLPVGRWLVRDLAFREVARDSLSTLAGRGLTQPKLVDSLFSRHLEEHPGYYGEMVWILMMLEQWLRSHEPAWAIN